MAHALAGVGNEIVCPYHGFRYNETGACTLIPAQDPKIPISAKLNLKTYPAVERYGLIWTRLNPWGDGSVEAVLPNWPEFEDPAWQIIPMVEDQRPEDLPLELTEEAHIHADRFSIAFRQALGQLGLGRPFSS